jgi:hypothetical protein
MPVLVTVQQESPEGPEDRTGWKLAQCPACLKVTLVETKWCPPDIDESQECWHFLYPLPVSAPQGLPADVALSYAAARKVRNIDSNAFAVLLGRVLDKVCIDKQVTGASLYDRLTKLANTGEIPPRLAEMAQQLRQLRNIGAHADLGELTPREVPILDALCRAVLEYVYTAPAMLKRVETRMKRLKTG